MDERTSEHSPLMSPLHPPACLPPYAPFADATEVQEKPASLRTMAERHGHLLLRGLLPESAIAPLRDVAINAARIEGLITTSPTPRLAREAVETWGGYADPRWVAMQQIVLAHEAARTLPTHPSLLALFEALYEGAVRTHRGDICRVGLPHDTSPQHTTPPHQDHFYVGGSTKLWTAWTPLLPCPLELGPLALIDGSHHRGFLRHHGQGVGQQEVALEGEPRWSSEALSPGDVVIFHCMCVHGALPNLSRDRPRLSFDMRFQPADATLDITRVDGSRP